MPDLTVAEWVSVYRTGLLLVPVAGAALLIFATRPGPREATAAMVSFLWQLPALLVVHLLAGAFGFWHFDASSGPALLDLPVDIWIGWAFWWGPVASLATRWLPIWSVAAIAMIVDAVSMPLLHPLVVLSADWLIGDLMSVVVALLPGLWFSRLTRTGENARRRSMFHVLGWGGYLVLVLPACAFAYEGGRMTDLFHSPDGGLEWCLIVFALLLLFVGVAATAEFARAGDGTPIPLDPPRRVVSTGPYAFLANPMQVISAAFMLTVAAYSGSWGCALIGGMFLVFDSIFASWYNRAHIAHAMPDEWSAYRHEVRDWRPNWRPSSPGRAEIVISPDGPARYLWDHLWPRLRPHLRGELTVSTVTSAHRHFRLTYRPQPMAAGAQEDRGVLAAARILEHGPLPLAALGWALRFPYLGGGLQRLSALVIGVYRTWRPHRSR